MRANLSIFSFKSGPRKFLLRLTFFIFLVIIVDFLFGKMIKTLYERAPHDVDWTKVNWAISEPYDIMVFGSSRAFRHYVPSIISEKLGKSVFNAGQNGQYLLYAYAVEQLVLDKHPPKFVILDVLPSYIVKAENPNREFERLDALAPFFHNKKIQALLTRNNFYERVKYVSSLYRFNSKFLSLLDNFITDNPGYDNGFQRVGPVEFHNKNPFITDTLQKIAYDSVKIHYLEQFITTAKSCSTHVVFSMSPALYELSPENLELIKNYERIAQQYDIPFFDFTQHDSLKKKEYFMDIIHMNEPGARNFSKVFSKKMKECFVSSPTTHL